VAGAALVAALVAAASAPAEIAEPALRSLLRGMALLKGGAVLAGAALLWWRFGRPIEPRVAIAYVASLCLAASAAVLVWSLSHLVSAAAVFHVGELAFLAAMWRDHRVGAPGRAAPSSV
jgi:hypothetical protein